VARKIVAAIKSIRGKKKRYMIFCQSNNCREREGNGRSRERGKWKINSQRGQGNEEKSQIVGPA
jgi:hypothetical protein